MKLGNNYIDQNHKIYIPLDLCMCLALRLTGDCVDDLLRDCTDDDLERLELSDFQDNFYESYSDLCLLETTTPSV